MLKFAILLGLGVLLYRYAIGQWPWAGLFAKPTRSQAVFNARKLLGVEAGASREDIKAAHKRLIAMVHPDKGGTNAQIHEANDARDLLLNELPDQGVQAPTDSEEDAPPRD
ncbi:MAG: J domain-containing protein [Pseudomonadota bacterium]